jgi:catechol 2,3-dioxygenase-like lactoylglutathione lyase family enzyme
MRVREGAPVYVALVVRDLQRSIAFYRDVLGMQEIKQVVVPHAKVRTGGFAREGFAFRTFRLGPLALKLVVAQGTPRSTQGGVDDYDGCAVFGQLSSTTSSKQMPS